uniref:Uncharacterized protein n=1 Tax=Glossina pallidipes TaxID=7398 RepID=A0A1A9Z1Z7_GLOPL
MFLCNKVYTLAGYLNPVHAYVHGPGSYWVTFALVDLPSRNLSLSETHGTGRSIFLENRDVTIAKNSKAISPKLDITMASKNVLSIGVSDCPIHVAPATGVGEYFRLSLAMLRLLRGEC